MELKEARAILEETSRCTEVKHPKILISDLCRVVRFLLNEIDRIKTPIVSILPKRLSEDIQIKPRVTPMIKPQHPLPSSPYQKEGGQQKFRSGNAGDAE